MWRERRVLVYAAAGVVLSLAEPIGLLLVRGIFGAPPIPTELLLQRVTYIYVFVTSALLLGALGYLIGRQADRLEALAETDALTGLANQRALRRRLIDDLHRARRYGSPVSLLVADVDGLKRINDERGHAAGDRVIRRVADAIDATLREADLGARWGGDEFAVLMPDTPGDAARHSADRLTGHLRRRRATDGEPITVSIGIATFDPAQDLRVDAEELAHLADEAMYRAKRAGRDRVHAA
jgi:two-component system, cell cycle response regulator